MAEEKHIEILMKGARAWNRWREANPNIIPDLSNAELSKQELKLIPYFDTSYPHVSNIFCSLDKPKGANFCYANLCGVNLTKAKISHGDFSESNLEKAIFDHAQLHSANFSCSNLNDASMVSAELINANFSRAKMQKTRMVLSTLDEADFSKANLTNALLNNAYMLKTVFREANLTETNLSGGYLKRADFTKAKLVRANLISTVMVEADLSEAEISECYVYGISAWKINTKDADQRELVITPDGESSITVDNLRMAQFLYMVLENDRIRDFIDASGKKIALILGRFSNKDRLLAIKAKLRQKNYIPVIFDFEKPNSQTFIQTIKTLASISRFAIIDLAKPKISLQELPDIAKIGIPIMPLLPAKDQPPITLIDTLYLQKEMVLEPYRYRNTDDLLSSFNEAVINPLENKLRELEEHRDYIAKKYERN
jgi:uncharacterized protein YjbI with pentapeptide repeats